MPRRRSAGSIFVTMAYLVVALKSGAEPMQTKGAPGGQRFRLLRSVSGSRYQESAGRVVIEDPRTTFQIPGDNQVVIFFEWQGPPGQHHVECFWKNPEGKVVSSASLDQAAPQGRFGAYWSMPLSEKTALGSWTLEASVDGEAAGSHTINVLSGAGAPIPVTRRLLTPGDVYKRATAATVFVEKHDPSGRPVARGSGFFLGDGALLTAFQTIDGASALTLILSDGRRLPASEVIAWNRAQDWALLKVPRGLPGLELGPARSWVVGDRCFSLDPSLEGSRVIVDLSIAGRAERPQVGERLLLSGQVSSAATGSPLLNEYGEAIGIVGVAFGPDVDANDRSDFRGRLRPSQPLLATPTDLVPRDPPPDALVSLAEFAKSPDFMPLLTAQRHIFQASFGRKIEGGAMPTLVDQGSTFSRRDGQIALWVMWEPKERLKTTQVLRMYDLNNKLLVETRPSKLDLQPGPYSYSGLLLNVSKFPAAIYRVDILVGTEPAWRGYLRIRE